MPKTDVVPRDSLFNRLDEMALAGTEVEGCVSCAV